jgi:hypothetical protein
MCALHYWLDRFGAGGHIAALPFSEIPLLFVNRGLSGDPQERHIR